MEWYRTSVSAGPSQEVLLARIEAQVAKARESGRLTDTAQIYLVPSDTIGRSTPSSRAIGFHRVA